MHKLLLFALTYLCSFVTAFSQDSLHVASKDTFKAGKKNFVTELNINPFKGELSLNNALNQIKLRYFMADHIAIRIGFSANNIKDNTSATSPYGTNPVINTEVKKATTLSINAGVEKHFTGTKRLSPYLGAEVLVAEKAASHDITTRSTSTKIEGAWGHQSVGYGYEERAYFQYGANLVAGFDFYMAKHFYLGYEMTFGFSNTKYADIDISTIYTSDTNIPSENTAVDYDDKTFSIGPNLINGIRLGYAF